MLAKNWAALGSWRKQDRPRSVDLLGFASQLMFTTALLNFSNVLESGKDHDLAYAVARAHTRHMVEFCSVDRRLLPTGYVPLLDFERTAKAAREAIEHGRQGAADPVALPGRPFAQPHRLRSAVGDGAGSRPADRVPCRRRRHAARDRPISTTACRRCRTSTAATTISRSIDYMAIGYAPMKALTALIVDRVLDRFPRLKFGVIEQGASWVPGWMRNMD